MLYSNRSIYISVECAIALIAKVATKGDLIAAAQDFVRAAGDGAIQVWGTSLLRLHEAIKRGDWHTASLERFPKCLALAGEGIFYTDLEVRRTDVEHLWLGPSVEHEGFGAKTSAAAPRDEGAANMPTGAPGRPSKGTHLIGEEFKRRLLKNSCKTSLREEATELRRWFCSQHPDAQPPTVKTIENKIRADYHRWAKLRG
jgi:hypothetical protein